MKELFPEKTGVSTSVKVIGSSQKRVMRKFTSNGKTSVASTSSKPTKRQSVSPPAVATGSTDAVSKGKGRAAFVTKTNPGNRKGTVSSKVIVGVKESSAVTTSLKRTESRFAPPSVASGAPGAVSEMIIRSIRVSKSKDALKATDPTPKKNNNSAAQVAAAAADCAEPAPKTYNIDGNREAAAGGLFCCHICEVRGSILNNYSYV